MGRLRQFKKWYKPRASAYRDFFIFSSVTIGIFLPARLFFYEYVTHHLFPNLGIVSAIAIAMFLLIRSDKIGFVGRAFRRQMMRFTSRNTFKNVLIISLLLNVYLGFMLYYVERGEFYYAEQRNTLDAIVIYQAITEDRSDKNEIINAFLKSGIYPEEKYMMYVSTWSEDERVEYATRWLDNDDFAMAVTMYESNVLYGGMPSHFNTVFMIEQIETVGLWFLYKRWYSKKVDIMPLGADVIYKNGETIISGGFDKKLKKLMYRNPKKDKLSELEIDTKFFLFSAAGSLATVITLYVYGLDSGQSLAILLGLITMMLIIYRKYKSNRLSPKHKKQFRNLIIFSGMMAVFGALFVLIV